MRIKIIFSSKNGPVWAGPDFKNPAHINFKGPLSGPAYIYLSPTRSLSGPLNTPRLN